jgi:hypothetical protein
VARYAGKQASSKVKKVMGEYGHGTLRSSSGQKVTDVRQAYAIAKSEERRMNKRKRRKK